MLVSSVFAVRSGRILRRPGRWCLSSAAASAWVTGKGTSIAYTLGAAERPAGKPFTRQRAALLSLLAPGSLDLAVSFRVL